LAAGRAAGVRPAKRLRDIVAVVAAARMDHLRRPDVPKLIILYGQPDDPAAFEDYYANKHLPYAAEHMPHVRAAENLKIIGTAEDTAPPYYRLSQLTYNSLDDLRAGLTSNDGQSVIADLANFATGGATILLADE
jgi:uncharacterized protein (TIGR02118 family)